MAKPKSKIMAAIHETAKDLYEGGLIDLRRMREYDAACLKPVEPLNASEIQRIRKKAQVSQAVFAHFLNVRTTTVQKWETGDNKPSGPALKLLRLVEAKGLDAVT